MVIGYVLKGYPRLSETFILHEILRLEERRIDLEIFSILDPHEKLTNDAVGAVRAPVQYLHDGRWRTVRAIVRGQVWLVQHHPKQLFQVWGSVLLRRRHRMTMKRLLEAGRLSQTVAEREIAWLHAHFAHGPTSVADFVHQLTGVPFSFSAHAKDIYQSAPDLLREKIGRAEFVATCTDTSRRYLADLFRGEPDAARQQEKIRLVYHGVDVRRFTPSAADDHSADPLAFPRLATAAAAPASRHAAAAVVASGQPTFPTNAVAPSVREEGEDPMILSVGRLVEKKGFSDLVTACQVLVARGHRFQCAIYGGGPLLAELQRQIADGGLTDRVVLLGACRQEELVAAYRSAAIFALAPCVATDGDRDGIPNVLLEAMACGLPVVTTPVGGITELVVPEESGVIVPERDPLALAEALERLLVNPRERARLGAAARARVVSRFDAEQNLEQLIACFPLSAVPFQPIRNLSDAMAQDHRPMMIETRG